MKNELGSFFETIQGAQRVLVLDLGFLGDTIHLIPALRCIREALPEAKLDVMVSEHIQSILEVTPWVDTVLGYPRFPKGPRWYQDLGRVRRLRQAKYDVVINLNGSDRSSILTWASGAPVRLGRIPPKTSLFWRHCFTHTVWENFSTKPLFRQRWNCLKQAGFPGDKPAFGIEIPEAAREKVESLLSGLENFIHLSPFTTLDYKELPIPVMAAFLNRLREAYPEKALVISCAPNDREREKLKSLLPLLMRRPEHVFDGTLNLVELTALISKSTLHIGGDSGALHVAAMTGMPTLSWFRNYEAIDEWKPEGTQHRALVGEASESGLVGIDADALESACKEALS
ncbi:MAG: putative lipopolysaccharide heptosyltransferase III [Opitutales bacterium]|tara:strand:+ start:2720 stop:3745 length:1026 start_codon:yes stop_codon:yes gene_type:complete